MKHWADPISGPIETALFGVDTPVESDNKCFMGRSISISYSKQTRSAEDYREDCRALSPVERLACIQRLRIAFWGDVATTGRLQRVPEYLKRGKR